MKISEIITDKYKLRMPPTVYYDLLADVHEVEEEQESTTKNDLGVEDCVSRAEVLKLMKDNWHTHNGDWAMQESMDDIRALPSVTLQEPKTGHWSHDGSHWKNRFICSECGYKLFDEPTNYCPNCGAKMVEPQESEDKE
ncbi:zinc ribbon domain-containing protein [Butyrivibrio sp. AE2032]|uniref:zinc ribbon domain-containing protein n=1 Tax=Butyrivibrio sp. AE2032 TaxID=1458463 RepID=UPI00054D7993|nr:zinc ribbon domain-containing protein [Butyrivibrio sp. AE2032]